MKLDSPLFDRIRVKPEEDRRPRTAGAVCDHPGCGSLATHRAPKGRTHEQEYWRFCLDHVRAYNQSYNYFAGMSQDAVLQYQKDAVVGHRPTWKMGFNGDAERFDAQDPLDLIREFGPSATRARHERKTAESSRPIHNAERKAFDTLDLEIDASAADIKARFKELVKRHHPDANGGDRSSEDRLVEIIQAYNYLKATKFC
jgi:DnaJ domain